MQSHWSHFLYSPVFSNDHMLILHAPHADHTQCYIGSAERANLVLRILKGLLIQKIKSAV